MNKTTRISLVVALSLSISVAFISAIISIKTNSHLALWVSAVASSMSLLADICIFILSRKRRASVQIV